MPDTSGGTTVGTAVGTGTGRSGTGRSGTAVGDATGGWVAIVGGAVRPQWRFS